MLFRECVTVIGHLCGDVLLLTSLVLGSPYGKQGECVYGHMVNGCCLGEV